MKPHLAYPVSPISVNQPFGASVAYYEKNFGQKGHPGIDFQASHGEPVYAAHDGEVIAIKDAHGGEGLWNYAPGFITISWHLIGDTDPNYLPPIPFSTTGIRTPVKKGDLIGYADNTGAPYESSGDHLHFGLMLTNAEGIVLNQDNGTQGCIDPKPYLDSEITHDPAALAAQDTAQLAHEAANINPASPTAPQQLSLAAKAFAFIKQMLQLGN